jgi:hypothetical protein
LKGTKALKVSNEKPAGDWMTKRSLHQYPYDQLGQRFGVAAFVMMCAMALASGLSWWLADQSASFDWFAALAILSFFGVNILGIFSQVLTGGRSWHGAVALGGLWIVVLCVIVILSAS